MANDKWTLAIGFRRALVHLIEWSVACGIVWIVALYLVLPLAALDTLLMMAATATVGAALGWLMVRNLGERAGFSGWIPMLLSIGFSVAYLLIGGAIVQGLRPVDPSVRFYAIDSGCAGAVAVIFWTCLADM